MKRFIVLAFAMLMISLSLCGCMDNTVDKVKDKASEALSDMNKDVATEHSNDNKGLLDDNRETTATDAPTMTESENETTSSTEGDIIATEWDDMVEDGEVEDGDGNVGDRENDDNDANVDPDAVD